MYLKIHWVNSVLPEGPRNQSNQETKKYVPMRGRISIRQKERKKQGVLRKDIETARALLAAIRQRVAAETELHPQRRMGIPN